MSQYLKSYLRIDFQPEYEIMVWNTFVEFELIMDVIFVLCKPYISYLAKGLGVCIGSLIQTGIELVNLDWWLVQILNIQIWKNSDS